MSEAMQRAFNLPFFDFFIHGYQVEKCYTTMF